jgi:hypothetical protein
MNILASEAARKFLVLLCAAILLPRPTIASALPASYQEVSAQAVSTPSKAQAPKIPNEQLDSLVAPIALYPDPLLAQTLAASTYPLEIVQLSQWLAKNKTLKDKALADAVAKQPWDPSVQSMAGLPDVVKRLADDIQWTTDLGNAFLAQQADVMDAVQRMRMKAKDMGNLKSNEQIKVETKTVESKTVVVVEQANPEVIYVPTYNPTVVYGAPLYYPYPPIYYPPPYYGMAISFGVGVAMGAMWGGGWGYGCGWGGGNNIYINNNNNFNRISHYNSNRTNINSGNVGSGNWQHNPQHRGGTPYSDRSTADRFGGTARGDSLANRQSGARQQLGQQGGLQSQRTGVSDRSSSGGGASLSDRSSSTTRSAGSGGADRVGSRDVSRSSSSASRSAWGGGSGGFQGSSARSSSMRGASSMRGGGGGRRR